MEVRRNLVDFPWEHNGNPIGVPYGSPSERYGNPMGESHGSPAGGLWNSMEVPEHQNPMESQWNSWDPWDFHGIIVGRGTPVDLPCDSDIFCLGIHHIISISSGIYWDIG